MFKVTCPICGGKLVIDDAAREVVSHTAKEDLGKDSGQRFEDALGKLRQDVAEREGKVDWARARAEERRKKAEETFKKAREKAEEEGDVGPPPGPVWD